MGIGLVAIQTSQKKEVSPPSGFPFTSGSAHEGTSIDAAGKVILGQTVGAAGNPALLDRNAEVPVDASGRTVTFRDLASTLETILGVGVVTLLDKLTNLPRIALQTAVAGNNGTIANNAGTVEIRDSTNAFRLKTNLSTGDTEVTGTIKTGDGNLGDPPAQPWNLGEAVVVPGLTFNDTVFVEVCINGVQWNLATINLPA